MKGRACSKWKTKSSKAGEDMVDLSFLTISKKSYLFSFLGTYRWMCGLVGADVVKMFGHNGKTERDKEIGGVQTCAHALVYLCNKNKNEL